MMQQQQVVLCPQCSSQNPALLRRCAACSSPLDKSKLQADRAALVVPPANTAAPISTPVPAPRLELDRLAPPPCITMPDAVPYRVPVRAASPQAASSLPALLPPVGAGPAVTRAWLGFIALAALIGIGGFLGALLRHRRPSAEPPRTLLSGPALQAATKSLVLIELVPQAEPPSAAARRTGTGVLVSSDGLLLTSYDLWAASYADSTQSLLVTIADGSVHAVARCAAASSENGLALLQINTRASLAMPLSTRWRLKTSEQVILIGAMRAAVGAAPTYPYQTGTLVGETEEQLSKALRYPLLLEKDALFSAAPVVLSTGELLGMLQLPQGQVRSGYVSAMRDLMPLLRQARQPDAPPCK